MTKQTTIVVTGALRVKNGYSFWGDICITKTCLFKYTENFYHQKNENFKIKKILIFFIYLLKTYRLRVFIRTTHNLCFECQGGSNEYPQSIF